MANKGRTLSITHQTITRVKNLHTTSTHHTNKSILNTETHTHTQTHTIDKDGEEAVKERLQSLVPCGDDLMEHNNHQVCMGACVEDGEWIRERSE